MGPRRWRWVCPAHPFAFVILSAATVLRHSHKERPREGPL